MRFGNEDELVAEFGQDTVERAAVRLSREHPRYQTREGLRRRCEWIRRDDESRQAENRSLLGTRPRAEHFRKVVRDLIGLGWSPISGTSARDITEQEVEEAALVLTDLEREVAQFLDWQDAYRQTALVCSRMPELGEFKTLDATGVEMCPTFDRGGFKGPSRADYVAIAMGHRPLSLSPWATQTTSSSSPEGSTNLK